MNPMKVCGAVVMLVSAGASAQGTLYAIQENNNTLVSYDPVTLQRTVIGPMGVPGDFGDMAFDAASQTMYYIDGRSGNSALYTVDLGTGAATMIGVHGQAEMFGLEWDPSTGKLYAGQSTQAQGFWEINPANGAATFIGNPGINLDSLAYDSKRGTLIGAYAGPGDLYSMNRNNGAATSIYDGAFFDNGGLTYDPDRDVLWYADWSGFVYQFDPNNGYARSTILSGQGAHDAMTYVGRIPAPGAAALLAGAGLLAARRRR